MKKILLMTCQYNGVYGATTSMIQLVKALNKKTECTVLTTNIGALVEKLNKESINNKIIKLGETANVFGGKILDYNISKKILVVLEILAFQFKLFCYLKKSKTDIIYANDPRSFFMICMPAKLSKLKTITYIRADQKNNFMTRFCLKNSDKIITIANGLLNEMPKDIMKKNISKIKTINTGFDFINYDFSEKIQGLDEKKIKIGFVGSVSPRKGLDFIVNILSKLEVRNNIELVISGDMTVGYEDYYKNIYEKLEKSNIKFSDLGFQSNVHKVYNSIDILVLPSLSEGLPRVVIEAMAHGVPVIANNVGGTNQIIENGKNGFIEEPLDKENWEKDILELINNKQLREKMGGNAYKLVREKFSIEKFEKEINNMFS